MMRKIILGGGGDENQSYKSHKYFYNSLDTRKSVLYIPLAMDQKNNSWSNCMNWFYNAFKDFGEININLLTELEGLSIKFLNQFSGIYIGGGNTFKLMNTLKKSKFYNLLKVY